MSIELGNGFWKEVIAGRDAKIDELKNQIKKLTEQNETLLEQCNNAESQLGIAFEIMTDRQIAEYQHLFERSIDIEHSASTNHTQKGER